VLGSDHEDAVQPRGVNYPKASIDDRTRAEKLPVQQIRRDSREV
jgi:hypothetical protein